MSDPNGLTWAATLVSLAVAIPTAGHAVIYKRDPRSATLWVLLIALLPLGGSLLYGLFGINRYRRRARRLFSGADPAARQDLSPTMPEAVSPPLAGLAHLVGRATGQSLTGGNRIEPFRPAFRTVGSNRLSMASRPTRPCSPPSNRRGTASP